MNLSAVVSFIESQKKRSFVSSFFGNVIQKKRLFFLLMTTTFLCLLSTQSRADWISAGPYFGYVQDLSICTTNPDIVYAGTDNGVFKSSDGGATWSSFGLSGKIVRVIRAAPANALYVYAGTDQGLYRSSDGGTTWTYCGFADAIINALAVHPTNPLIAYAGMGDYILDNPGGIYKTVDGGVTWLSKYAPENLDEVKALLIDANDANLIYAGIRNSYNCYNFCRSTDAGENWVEVKFGLSTPGGVSLAMTPAGFAPAALYVVVDGDDVYKSSDQGKTWVGIAKSKIQVGSWSPKRISVDPNAPNTIYMGNGWTNVEKENFFKSMDGGETWAPAYASLPEGPISVVAVQPSDSSVWVGFPEAGLSRSTDGAQTWSSMAIPQASVMDLVAHPTDTGTVYAVIDGWGRPSLAKTSDGGETWGYLDAAPFGLQAVEMNPENPSILYAGSRYGYFYRSTNGGSSWDYTSYLYNRPINDIWVHPTNPNVILLAAEQYISYSYPMNTIYYGGVFRNTDGGTSDSWSFRFNWWKPTCLASDPANHNIIYLGVEQNGYVSRSNDGGLSWETISPSSDWVSAVYDLVVGFDSSVYAATSDGLWCRETAVWSKIATLPSEIRALAMDRSTTPDTLYAGTKQNGVYVSIDKGRSWIPLNKGMEDLWVTNLFISSSQPKTVYAGTMYSGVWSRLAYYDVRLYVNKDDATCGGKKPCYTSIQAAINAASTSTNILITLGTYAESITLNSSKPLTLKGGWDTSFTTQTANKTFIKAPSAPQGSLTMQMLTIKP